VENFCFTIGTTGNVIDRLLRATGRGRCDGKKSDNTSVIIEKHTTVGTYVLHKARKHFGMP